MGKKDVPGIGEYGGPAGGWGALQAVAKAIRGQMAVDHSVIMLQVNQPQGFDCPGCAWPDPREHSSFEFCENGAKAVSWEATNKRVTPAFFAEHTVSELWEWDDFKLEFEGRLTHPMVYDAATDKYVPIAWDEAFRRIGQILRELPDANMAEFYASGRASNEAAFLYQLFAREYGTNNFPDCSNMCHEATSVGLPQSIGVGKGTVTLDDFYACDAIFSFGHNPGTNHPRMMATLRAAALRGAPVVVFNPLKERSLERFKSPQSAIEMTVGKAVPIATHYYQPKVGGDCGVVKGIMKALLAADAAAVAAGGAGLLDRDFIRDHTSGYAALQADLDGTSWEEILEVSGLSREQIEEAAAVYAKAERVIVCYGMGITQHRHGTSNVQQLANLLLLRGNMGREGAGICPLRGHSNVQGDRTVGITEIPTGGFLDALERVYGFQAPREHGHGAVAAIEAMRDGRSKALICLGGNLPVAMSDPDVCFEAIRGLALNVNIATKLNRSHLLVGQNSFLLPCLGRTELDVQATGPQSVTVEDSMSMVHASRGSLPPASPELKSEPAIVAGIARATLPQSQVPWESYIEDYSRIRDAIEQVFPDFARYNERIGQPRGFRLDVPASRREWRTDTGRANFLVADAGQRPLARPEVKDALVLATVRSHDQYNTTIYGKNDRYRGITGRRDVIFVNGDDLAERGLQHGDIVDVEAVAEGDDARRVLRQVVAVAFDISRGSVAAYYPEANGLVALSNIDGRSGTPSYKSVPVVLRKAAGEARDLSVERV
ncbi:molybdopterin-dependent oxidoreductase alpha subunit [Pseudoduganella lurida]|uniref:Molybdopterin-dependent oxidoreductase alpha subunit n=1 Tax=Pseudoduganella lurida TaxID=1036180 RepID=A0A562QZ98_9BURK|nr:FdhF/YdeP family oxidoreductase [Pseudoduganella lurida]TWI61903.1 molybdopterin-dependent oxidoreductase alpha subunit [Pseudoduganella lurida]